jgi:predicted KAP-like P-loop ATPase
MDKVKARIETLNRFDPISDPSMDRIGRANFAANIADIIINNKVKSPAVIGLYGTWGYGKTSVLNMVEYYIKEKAPKDNINILFIKFNPWVNFQSHMIIKSMFDKIIESLQEKEFNDLADEFSKLSDELAALGVAIGSILPTAAIIAGLAVIPIRRISKRNRKSLETIRDCLKILLGEKKVKIIITIDDIDRLMADEIRQLFQAIKNIMDLPNIIFFISCDECAVATLLDSPGFSGHDFLEKIIQWPISIPMPDRLKYQNYVAGELNFLISFFNNENWDSQRWFSVLEGGLGNIFLKYYNLRKLHRFIVQALVNAESLKDNVNPIDYISIETIKHFYRPLYDLIYDYKLYVLGKEAGMGNMLMEQLTEELSGKKPIEYLKIELDKYDSNVKNLIKILFPNLSYILEGKENSGFTNPSWQIEKYICSSYHFENYFIQDLSTGNISQKVINDFINNYHTKEDFENILRNLMKLGLFDNFIDRINQLTEFINTSNNNNLMNAFIEISDELEYGHMILMTPIHHFISYFIFKILNKSPQGNEAEVLYQSFVSTKALFLPVLITWMIEYDLKENKQPSIHIDVDILESMKRLCAEKIDRAFREETLQNAKGLAIVLSRWKEWSNKNYANLFVEEKLDTKNLVILLSSYITRVPKNNFNIKSFSEIADIYKINTKVRRIKQNTLNDSEKETISLFIKAFDEFTLPGYKSNS